MSVSPNASLGAVHPTVPSRSRTTHPGAARALVLGVVLLPFWFDSLAFILFLFSRSQALYSAVLLSFEVVAVLGAAFYGLEAWRVLWKAYGPGFLWPALFYGVALGAVLVGNSGNQEFVLAAMRYLPWLIFVAGVFSRYKILPLQHHDLNVLRPVAVTLAVLALMQWLASPLLADSLGALHRELMPPERLNAVLTSIELEKSFASLTLRNPIELGYIGLVFICMGACWARQKALVVCGLILVAAGRSNTTLMAALVVLTIHAMAAKTFTPLQRTLMAALGMVLLLATVFALPTIYLGADANWSDLIETLGMQRLGLVLAVPALLDDAGWGLLLRGLPVGLEPLVEDLFQAGLLPSLFADGGAIAVFDIMWFGMLLVAGLPFIWGGVKLLTMVKTRAGQAHRAAWLFSIGAAVISFSSQILLSRYGLYFLCLLLAVAAVEGRQSVPRKG